MTEIWYRFEDYMESAGVDEWENSLGPGTVQVRCREFRAIRHTPKGVWLDIGYVPNRFVLKSATKQYACPTREDALRSFVARKTRQASIYRARVRRAEIALAKAQRMLDPTRPKSILEQTS
jgi:hypothetical protein